MPAWRHPGIEFEGNQIVTEIGVPERAAAEIDAVVADEPRRFLKSARIFLALHGQREIHRTAIGHLQRGRALGKADRVAADAFLSCEIDARTVNALKASGARAHDGSDRRIGGHDLELGREQKLDGLSRVIFRQLNDHVDREPIGRGLQRHDEIVVRQRGRRAGPAELQREQRREVLNSFLCPAAVVETRR